MPSQHIQLVIHCAGPNCDKTKAASNHWFICHVTDRFLLKPWDDDAVFQEDNVLPLCSDSCAIRMLSRYLSEQKSSASSVSSTSTSRAQGGHNQP